MNDKTACNAIFAAWEKLDRFNTLDAAVKMEACRILDCRPCDLQAWIDSKSDADLCALLF